MELPMNSAWVIGGRVDPSFLGLINKARELAAGKTCSLDIIAVMPELSDADAAILAGTGARRVYHLPLDSMDMLCEKRAADSLFGLWRRERPSFILVESSVFFCDTAAMLSAMTRCGITADCTDLVSDRNGSLLQIRPAFGGRKLVSNITAGATAIATVRRGVFAPPAANRELGTEIIRLMPEEARDAWTLLQTCIDDNGTDDLGAADMIVSGGLGLGSKENFHRLFLLGKLMGAAVGASRSAVAAGFATYAHQVGQTGVYVRPSLYIAFGISGAVQHLSGITAAKRIVAVNPDPKAPIHEYSDLSVLADCNAVIDMLIEKLKREN